MDKIVGFARIWSETLKKISDKKADETTGETPAAESTDTTEASE